MTQKLVPINEEAGLNDVVWNVVGQTYRPQILTENVFYWRGVAPADTFVPPHIHPTQDEWLTVLDGELEVEFPESETHVVLKKGDTVFMPKGIAHGIFNRSGKEANVYFGVAPARKLYDLFVQLDGLTDPEELVRISAEHEVDFLPAPPNA